MGVGEWAFRVGPGTATVPSGQVGQWTSAGFDESLDNGSTGRLSLPAKDPAARLIDELVTDVFTYLDGALWGRHRIVNVNQAWGGDGGDTIECTLMDYRALLNRRKLKTALTFDGEPQDDLVASILTTVQGYAGGALGLTPGTLASAHPRDREYLAGDNVGQRLRELTQVIDGPRLVFHPTKVYDVVDADTWPIVTTPLKLGMNVLAMNRASGADQFANAVFGTGDNAATTLVIDEAAGLASDPRGRWDAGFAWPTVKDQTTLVEHTAGALEDTITPVSVWRVVLDPARWHGDTRLTAGSMVTIVQPATVVAPIEPAVTIAGQVSGVSLTIDNSGAVAASATILAVG